MWVEVGGVELHQAHSQGEEGGAVSLRLPAVVQSLQQEHPHLHQGSIQQPSIFSNIFLYTRNTTNSGNQVCGSGSKFAWIRNTFGSWIRIRINRIRIHIKAKIQRLKIEPWRAVDAHNGGLEDENRALEGL